MQYQLQEIKSKIEKATDEKVVDIFEIKSGGYTPALRLIVLLADGLEMFAKVGVTEYTADQLRIEGKNYSLLRGLSFVPKVYNFLDGETPVFLLESLRKGSWPPPWNTKRIDTVLAALDKLHKTAIKGIKKQIDDENEYNWWTDVEKNPEPFLSLGLKSKKWLKKVLPELVKFDGKKLLDGAIPIHQDIRSDNVCFISDSEVKFIDWNMLCLGNPNFDIAIWLPSLEAEGGPRPESILPNCPEMAVMISGFFASRAGLPDVSNAPYVRKIQLTQLRYALPWVIRALNLPED